MNTRPRPVTATVTKPKWMEPHVIPRRSRSLESNGSTASLTSVLDHDSYVSPDISDEEWEAEQEKNLEKEDRIKEKIKHVEVKKEKKKKKSRSPIRQMESRLSDYDVTTCTEYSQNFNQCPNLSPWEQWLIQKTKEERVKKQTRRKIKLENKEKQELKIQEKKHNEEKAAQKRTEWLQQKNYEEKLRKKLEKQRIETELKIKEEQNQMTKMKAERKFAEWKNKKEVQDRERKELEKQHQREKELEEKCKQIKAQQKYEEWLRNAKNRPKSAQSFGYKSGKMTGYHDTGAYPAPTFYNPVPWHHNPIPKTQRSERPKTRSRTKKYVWNPDKYF